MSAQKPWLISYPENVPHACPANPHKALVNVFEDAFLRFRQKPALTNMGATLTYGQLDERSRQFASYLQHQAGLKPGDRIALQMPNVFQYPIAFIGALRAGLTVVNTNPLYTPREMEYQFKDSGAVAIVIVANFAFNLEKILAHTSIKTVIVTELGDQLGGLKKTLVNFVVKRIKKMVPPFHLPGAVPFNKALEQGAQKPFQKIDHRPEDVILLQYTGGTTGFSKGAMLTNANLTHHLVQFGSVYDAHIKEDDICIVPLPVYHITALFGLIFTLSRGLKDVLITNPRDIPAFVKELRKHPFTMFFGLNTLYNALLNHPDFNKVDFSRVKVCLAGGMAMQTVVSERWEKQTGVPILEGYGLSETSPILTINMVGKNRQGTVGLPIPGTEILIADSEGKPVPLGEAGELCARGPQVFQGYWQKDNREVFLPGGWFKTGDIAQMDEDGYFRIVDRKKDMILVSGFNVYPNEIENVVASHPKVLEVAAIGVKDDHSGEVVKLCVVKREASLTEEELKDYCKENLTAYKRPKYIEFKTELPKANTGKILRRLLREVEA
ncbi:MAG: AMP-binding protein [Cyclobacteriaceae bacterium]|jgi:long-chain acyl-CoA synthetase|nr:AMP-binding protein [Cyclobacteriaceae bacterium]